jgi:hypothetical protein
MRYPGQPFTWYVDSLPNDNTFRGVLTNDEMKRMINRGIAVYGSLGNTVPYDYSSWNTDKIDYNNRFMWVPQSDIQGSGRAESGIPCAAAFWATSNYKPYCFIVKTNIKFAKNPTDGTNQLCWQGDWCASNYCQNGCGDHNVDFLSVVVHELGHNFGLDDRYDGSSSSNTMYGYITERDTMQRTLTACEQNEISAVYINNPAALTAGLQANPMGSGLDVRWYEEMRSSVTASYTVSWSATWDSPRTVVASVPVNPTGTYQVTIPGYNAGVVHLEEVELNGRILPQGDELVSVPVVTPVEVIPANAESLCVAYMEQKSMLSATQLQAVQAQPIMSVIAVPDSLREPADALAQYWTQWEGVRTVVMSVDTIGGAMNINAQAFARMPSGGTLKLFGDVVDSRDVYGQPWHLDPTKFVNGFTDDGFPDQPNRDIIRTYFRPEHSAQRFSLAQGYPWTTSDADYLSRTRNGLVDSGYGVGRLPAANKAEAWAMVWKTISNIRGNPWGQIIMLNYLKDFGSTQGVVAKGIADSLMRLNFPSYLPFYRVDDSPTHPMSAAQRASTSAIAYSGGGLYGMSVSTSSAGQAPGQFKNQDGGFDPNTLAPNDGNLPVELDFTCYSANMAGRHNPAQGQRMFKRMFMAPSRGVRAWIGATTGTWLPGDGHLYYLWYLDWLAHPEKKIGLRLADVLRQDVELFPEDSTLAREIVLIGDPDLVVPAPSPPVVGVDPTLEHLKLGSFPNPSRHGTLVYWTLPQAVYTSLSVYDVTGRRLVTLAEGDLTAGVHHVQWLAHDTPPGIYFLRLQAGRQALTTKLVRLQ